VCCHPGVIWCRRELRGTSLRAISIDRRLSSSSEMSYPPRARIKTLASTMFVSGRPISISVDSTGREWRRQYRFASCVSTNQMRQRRGVRSVCRIFIAFAILVAVVHVSGDHSTSRPESILYRRPFERLLASMF